MIHIIALAGVLGSPDLAPAIPTHIAAPTPAASATLAQDEEAQAPAWHGSINLGYSTTGGNSDVETLSASFDANRETATDRITLKAFANRNSDSDVTTQRQMGASGQYDYFINERWYALVNTSAEQDRNAQIDLRYTAGAGAGYRIWMPSDESSRKLDVEAGLTYFSEEFDSGVEDTYLAAQLAARLALELRENIEFESDLQLYPSLEDSEDLNAKWDNRLRSALTESMFAQIQVVIDYDKSPAVDAGTGLELDDIDTRVVLTVGWSF